MLADDTGADEWHERYTALARSSRLTFTPVDPHIVTTHSVNQAVRDACQTAGVTLLEAGDLAAGWGELSDACKTLGILPFAKNPGLQPSDISVEQLSAGMRALVLAEPQDSGWTPKRVCILATRYTAEHLQYISSRGPQARQWWGCAAGAAQCDCVGGSAGGSGSGCNGVSSRDVWLQSNVPSSVILSFGANLKPPSQQLGSSRCALPGYSKRGAPCVWILPT